MTTPISDIIKTPEDVFGKEYSLEDYIRISRENLSHAFGFEEMDDKLAPFRYYVANDDHGAEHTYNVYKKSLMIAEKVRSSLGTDINQTLLYVMSCMHDSGRFRYSLENAHDTVLQKDAKKRKKTKAEREHAKYGVAQIKLAVKNLKSQGVSLDDEEIKKINNYILNHDFFNTRLDGDLYTEPQSLEGQIVRLADRISVPIEEEIARYRETGKRLSTKYFNDSISFEDRVNFNFVNIGNYIKSGIFDEITFFLALLSQSQEDFSNPILAQLYQERSSTKKLGIEKILAIAAQEGYSHEEINAIIKLIQQYLLHFNVHF